MPSASARFVTAADILSGPGAGRGRAGTSTTYRYLHDEGENVRLTCLIKNGRGTVQTAEQRAINALDSTTHHGGRPAPPPVHLSPG